MGHFLLRMAAKPVCDDKDKKKTSYLEVCELRILLFENISHVINQMQTKCIFGGDFL